MRTVTYDETQWKLVPIEMTSGMKLSDLDVDWVIALIAVICVLISISYGD